MNLHPIFVHFPVALLTIYALMELVRFKKVMTQPYWFYLKAVFLMLGGLGALAALYTGGMARSAVRQGDFVVAVSNFRQVLAMHENFAHLSVAVFGILAASYLFLWLQRENFSVFAEKIKLGGLWKLLVKFAHFFVETRLVIFMALAGLICITITGGLGGVMVYGPTADPFFGMIYHLMFPGM
jgi:uncharacterized membrane protein